MYVGLVLGGTDISTLFDLILESFWVHIDPEGFRLEVKWGQNINFTANKPYVHFKTSQKNIQSDLLKYLQSSGQIGSKDQFDLD